MNNTSGLRRFSSGYSASRSNWQAFLGCWRDQVNLRQARLLASGEIQELPIGANNISATEIARVETARQLDATETRLRVGLPRSFRDFQLATAGNGWYSDTDGYDQEEAGVRRSLYRIGDIGYLPDSDPFALKIWKNHDFQRPSDDEYYRYGYGSGQENFEWDFDGSRLRDMIKVGGLTKGTLILLNPNEVTSDEEMETWILGPWYGVVRYRSFAEMVREMAYRDINDTGDFLIDSGRFSAGQCFGYLVIE